MLNQPPKDRMLRPRDVVTRPAPRPLADSVAQPSGLCFPKRATRADILPKPITSASGPGFAEASDEPNPGD